MYIGIDAELLNPGRHEEPSGVMTNDFQLKHAVHEGDPVIGPRETTACTFDVASQDSAEEATGNNISI